MSLHSTVFKSRRRKSLLVAQITTGYKIKIKKPEISLLLKKKPRWALESFLFKTQGTMLSQVTSRCRLNHGAHRRSRKLSDWFYWELQRNTCTLSACLQCRKSLEYALRAVLSNELNRGVAVGEESKASFSVKDRRIRVRDSEVN